MRAILAGFAMLIMAAWCSAALAGDLTNFNTAMEAVASHNRVAIGYLRTGNTDLASLEIDRMRQAWGALQQRFAGRRPDPFDGNRLYGKTLTGVSARLICVELLLNAGRPDAAMDSLNALRGDFYELRKASGIAVQADCVRDANQAMDALMVYDDRALDFAKPEIRYGVAGKASIYGHVLERCDGMAGEPIHGEPEFRRLVDGAKASLSLIPKAVETSDAGLLHRVLIELRSFD